MELCCGSHLGPSRGSDTPRFGCSYHASVTREPHVKQRGEQMRRGLIRQHGQVWDFGLPVILANFMR